jgi:hypothetical protein
MTASGAAQRGEVVLCETSDGEPRLERESVWLPLLGIAELFGRDRSVSSRHLRNLLVDPDRGALA